LKHKGKLLDIVKAPEPDQVGWEYLEISTLWKQFYRTLTGIIATIILLICFAVIVQGSIYKTKFAKDIPSLYTCESVIPVDFAYAMNVTNYGKYSLVRPPKWIRPSLDARCEAVVPDTFYAVYAESSETYATNAMVPYNVSMCAATAATGVNGTNDDNGLIGAGGGLCPHPVKQLKNQFCPCVSITSSETCGSIGCFVSSPETSLVCQEFSAGVIGSCYCYLSLTSMIENDGVSATMSYIKNSRGDACFQFFETYSSATALTYGATVVTIVINEVLKVLLVKLTKLECHSQIDMKHASLMFKLFLSTYFNMALVVLIAFGHVDGLPYGFKVAHLFQGSYDDFTSQWYGVVGSYLVLTFLIQVVSGPVYDLALYAIVNPCKRTIIYPHVR
jgi:hypothetical protein